MDKLVRFKTVGGGRIAVPQSRVIHIEEDGDEDAVILVYSGTDGTCVRGLLDSLDEAVDAYNAE